MISYKHVVSTIILPWVLYFLLLSHPSICFCFSSCMYKPSFGFWHASVLSMPNSTTAFAVLPNCRPTPHTRPSPPFLRPTPLLVHQGPANCNVEGAERPRGRRRRCECAWGAVGEKWSRAATPTTSSVGCTTTRTARSSGLGSIPAHRDERGSDAAFHCSTISIELHGTTRRNWRRKTAAKVGPLQSTGVVKGILTSTCKEHVSVERKCIAALVPWRSKQQWNKCAGWSSLAGSKRQRPLAKRLQSRLQCARTN